MTLEREAPSLLAEIRAATSGRDDRDAATAFLSAAPAAACQRLTDLWDTAGPDRDAVRGRLPVEDQLLLDMVVTACPPARPDSHHNINLGELVDHTHALATAGH